MQLVKSDFSFEIVSISLYVNYKLGQLQFKIVFRIKRPDIGRQRPLQFKNDNGWENDVWFGDWLLVLDQFCVDLAAFVQNNTSRFLTFIYL
jgi:hypothetical protein